MDGADPRIRLLKYSRCHLLLAKCFSRVPSQRSADGANDANHHTRNFTELFEESRGVKQTWEGLGISASR